jgi:hypothetical protein
MLQNLVTHSTRGRALGFLGKILATRLAETIDVYAHRLMMRRQIAKNHFGGGAQSRILAERERFELSVELLTLRRFSKPLLSTTQPPLRRFWVGL